MTDRMDEIATKVRALVAARVPRADSVDGAAVIRDLGLDSVAVMDLVMAVEDEFDLVFPLDRLGELETVDDLARVVAGLLGDKAEAP